LVLRFAFRTFVIQRKQKYIAMQKNKDLAVAKALAAKLAKAKTDKAAKAIISRLKKKMLAKYTLATCKKKLTIYRKHSPKYKELLCLTAQQYSEIEATTKQGIIKRTTNQIGVSLDIIEVAKQHLNSSDKYKRAVAIQLLIGRRISEVLFSARLSPIHSNKALFSGQLKKKETERRPYQIPTLADAHKLADALKQVQAAFNCQSLEDTDAHNGRLNSAARQLFSDYLGEDLTTHSLRRCYTALAYYLEGSKKQHISIFAGQILGHEAGGTAVNNYYQFYIKDDI